VYNLVSEYSLNIFEINILTMSKKTKKEAKEFESTQEKEIEEAKRLKDRIKEMENLKSTGKVEELFKLVLGIV
jgi:hypothetical protein